MANILSHAESLSSNTRSSSVRERLDTSTLMSACRSVWTKTDDLDWFLTNRRVRFSFLQRPQLLVVCMRRRWRTCRAPRMTTRAISTTGAAGRDKTLATSLLRCLVWSWEGLCLKLCSSYSSSHLSGLEVIMRPSFSMPAFQWWTLCLLR